MDRALRSIDRPSMLAQPQNSPPPLDQPARPAVDSHSIAPRPGHALDGVPPTAGGYNATKVAKNAGVSAAAIGVFYGTFSAINSAARATPAWSTAAKVAVALLPSASVSVTPWIEDGSRQALGTTATYPIRPSLAHDAVASLGLFLFNAGWTRSSVVPKFPAATPAGMLAAVVQCTLASAVAGGASELSAQWMNESAREAGHREGATVHIDNARKGTGRLYSQVPAAAMHVYLAIRGKPLPAPLALAPAAIVSGGWAFRRQLMPPAPAQAGEIPASKTNPCVWPPEPAQSTIPPA